MGILSTITSIFSPRQAEDPFFGTLLYIDLGAKRKSYWEGKRLFRPTRKEIELFIDAPGPDALPNELQRAFYSTIESEYTRLLQEAGKLLIPEMEVWLEKKLAVSVEKVFVLTSLKIPNASREEAEWEMSFDTSLDDEHMCTVTFRGMTPQSVCIDG